MAGSSLATKMAVGCVVGVAAGFAASLVAPKIYEGRAEIWIQGDERQQVLGKQLETQLALLRSEGVYREAYKAALRRAAAQTRQSEPVEPNLGLYKMYSVEDAPDSAVAMVRVRAYDPQFASDLANQISLMYRVIRAKATNTAEAAKQQGVIQRADRAKGELDKAEKALQDYKAQSGSPDLSQTTQQTLSYEASLSSRLNDARADFAATQQELATLSGQIKMRPKTSRVFASQGQNPEVIALQNSLSDLQRQRIDLLRTYTETSSKVRGIDEAIKDAQAKLTTAMNKPWQTNEVHEVPDPQREQYEQQYSAASTKLSALRSEIRNLSSTLGGVRGEVARLPAAQRDMQRYQRAYDLALTRYNTIQQQLADKETTALPAQAGSVTLHDATPDSTPVSPNVPLLLLLGGAIGLLGGGIYGIATKKDTKPVRTSDDLERLTGLSASTVLGLPRKKEEQLLRSLPQPGSKPAEAFRYMALTMPPGEGAKKVLFTGVGSDAGCSSAAGQFALALACEGRHTLLVDCDFRQSSLTHVFGSEQKPGLSDILRKTLLPSADNEVSMATQHENLLFLPSGSSGDGSIADFSHSQLRAAIEMLTERADMIVLDSPPCDVVTDAVRLCPLVDEVYLIVGAEDTESSKVNMANNMLRRCGAKVVHVMLTGGNPADAPFSAA